VTRERAKEIVKDKMFDQSFRRCGDGQNRAEMMNERWSQRRLADGPTFLIDSDWKKRRGLAQGFVR
jgi:hypothetical protein